MDLTPGYRELRPPRALRGVVGCFWLRVCAAPDEVRVLPDGCTDLIWRQGEGTMVAGPDTAVRLENRAPGDLLVGMRFLPGAGGVLGVPLDELRDLRVDLADLDRRLDLDGELAPSEVATRFAIAAAGREPDPLVVEATRRLGRQGVGALAEELGISERQLRRRFEGAAGYGPKTLARILRFNRFVEAADRGHTNLARLALDVGYADQAHLTRETTRLAGLPPAAFLRSRA